MKRSYRFWRRTSLPIVVFCICLLILCVPIGIMVTGYGIALNNTKEQVLHTQTLTVQRVRDLADASLQEAFNQMKTLSDAVETVELAGYGAEADAKRGFALAAYQKKITETERLLPVSAQLMAYFEGSDLIVGATGLVKRSAFEWFATRQSISVDALEGLLHSQQYRDTAIVNQGQEGCVIALTQRVYNTVRRKATATILVLFPYERFIDTVQNNIINASGRLYLENEQGALGLEPPAAASSGSWQKSSLPSRVCPFTYTYYTEESVAFEPLRSQRLALMALLVAALIFGLALIGLFVYNTQRKTQSLLHLLMPEETDAGRQELGKIMESIERLNTERRENALLKSKDKQAARERLMLSALKEEQTVVDDWAEALEEAGLPADGEYEIVLFDNVGAKTDCEALAALVRDAGGVAVFSASKCLALIASPNALWMPALQAFMARPERAAIRCALGNAPCTLGTLDEAYRQAEKTLRYGDFWAEMGTMRFDCVPQGGADAETAPSTALSGKVVNAICAGDYQSARAYADELMETLPGRTMDTLDIDMCLLKGMAAQIVQALTQHAPMQDREAIEQLHAESRLLSAHSFPEMRRALNELFEALIYCQHNRQETLPPYIAQVQAEIERAYADQDLSISKLADTCGYNASYLSHYYKKYTGTGILDCLHQRRIAEAQKLLKGGMSVREVAEKTGYADSRSLIRAFKRYIGITPGQYGK